jgi:hypothetical protein
MQKSELGIAPSVNNIPRRLCACDGWCKDSNGCGPLFEFMYVLRMSHILMTLHGKGAISSHATRGMKYIIPSLGVVFGIQLLGPYT